VQEYLWLATVLTGTPLTHAHIYTQLEGLKIVGHVLLRVCAGGIDE